MTSLSVSEPELEPPPVLPPPPEVGIGKEGIDRVGNWNCGRAMARLVDVRERRERRERMVVVDFMVRAEKYS